MRILVLATTLLLSLSLGAHAQTQTESAVLQGEPQSKIRIDKLDSNSVRCGLTEDGIRKAIFYSASSASFQVLESAITDFAVSLSTLYFEQTDFCVTHLLIVVRSSQTVTLKAVWARAIDLSGAKGGHQQRLLQAIENLTKGFVIDWNLANK